jgi:hypothetical protein
VPLVGLSDGPIPWPIGKLGRHSFLILDGALVEAGKRESANAVCHGWGVGMDTVWR